MSQYFDFVALGWIEKYLREEMASALASLQSYEREPTQARHVEGALRSIHSATGVLRLCALDPAALLTQEIERVLNQLIDGVIAGEARKLALTELVAGIEALPAYLANVRTKREVSAGVIANVINDLRRFGSRPPLPDSLFFNPPIKPGAGVSTGQRIAEEDKLKLFGERAMQVCFQHSQAALKRDRESLKRLYSVGKHASSMLAGSQMEPYFRCYMGLVEMLAQPHAQSDEVIADIFKYTFVFLKSLARNGALAIDEANPAPYVKKMLYYIARGPRPTALQQTLRDTFGVQDVDAVRIESSGRLVQEDDLLDALNHTLGSLLEVMEFITSEHRDICIKNSKLVATIVPRLRQVGLQLKAIGLNTHAETIIAQHAVLQGLSQRDEKASQTELLGFGGALVAVRESLEHKLKHGLTAEGDSMGHELDTAIREQTVRCLNDMKNSINREFGRNGLLKFIDAAPALETVSIASLRPLYRAAALTEDVALQESMECWEQGTLPPTVEVVQLAQRMLTEIPEHAYAQRAAADMQQVLSVLGLMEDMQRESGVLQLCTSYIRESIAQGGLENDAGMSCFAEAIAALEQYMERRTADPLGNADDHLLRAEARAQMLAGFIAQRSEAVSEGENVLEFGSPLQADVTSDDLELENTELETSAVPTPESEVDTVAPAEPKAGLRVVSSTPAPSATVKPVAAPVEVEASAAVELPWQEALLKWRDATITRGAEAPLEDPSVDIDEELVDCFVEESRKYLRRLQGALPQFAQDLGCEKAILEIRAIFHTMKGSARTIELNEFGEFMYSMEKVFNALRDGYIAGSSEIVELLEAVTGRLPAFIELLLERVPLYSVDFRVPHSMAIAIAEKCFDAQTSTLMFEAELKREPALVVHSSVAEIVGSDVTSPGDSAAQAAAPDAPAPAAERKSDAPMERVWKQYNATAILQRILPRLDQACESEAQNLIAARAKTLVRALVPAMVELREGDFLDLDDATLVYFLDLPVIEHLASNAVFGLVDNGQGEFFKFPLTVAVTNALQSYLDSLVESEEAAEAGGIEQLHAVITGFVLESMSLTDCTPMANMPGQTMSQQEMDAYQVAPEVAPDPKPEADSAPEVLPERALVLELLPDLPLELEVELELQPESEAELKAELEVPAEPEMSAEPELPAVPLMQLLPDMPPLAAAVVAPVVIEVEIDFELLDLFIETLDEYLEGIDAAVAQMADKDLAGLQRLKNTLHTVKGGANSVGLRRFGTLVHDFESLLSELEHTGVIAADTSMDLIYPWVDTLQQAARFMRRQRRDWDSVKAAAADLAAADDEAADTLAELYPEERERKPATNTKRVESLRVSTAKIDRLLDTGLEISMSNVRSRRALDAAQTDKQEVQGLARRVQTLVDKLSLQLDTEIQAKTEANPLLQQFDPLEMDRITEKQSLAAILREAAFDLHEQAGELGDYIDSSMREAVSMARLIESSQSEMRMLRLVSFAKLGPGFRRLVHQLSQQLCKQVDFEFSCDDGGLDVAVFEQVKIALEHMLRNAIDHGIDTPQARAKRGKSETGKISLLIFRQASEFVIQLLDDGNGLDPALLRAKAVEKGLLSDRHKISDEEALRLIFNSGLSTADKVTDVSGRGVGMDIVHQVITQVGGNIAVQSKPGFFAQFDIRIPASIMVNGALLASIGDEQVAIPLTSLVGSDFRHRDEIHRETHSATCELLFRDEKYQLRYLGAVRGTLPPPNTEALPEFVPILFAQHGRRRVAFYVDAVTNAEELVIRSLGAQFTGVPGVAGGCLKSDGQPVLALDLNELIRQVDYADEIGVTVTTAGVVEANTLILCVDDSVMMRRTYEKRLRSLGYDVVTAVDGEEALDYLSETARLPDFIFTDLEMPNMNGFDFIANLRRSPLMEKIPTVVVSSRDGEKHREESQRVGATDFMAKGANSAEGMGAVIERYLGKTALAS